MEQLNLTLIAVDARLDLPAPGQYVYFLTVLGDLHYGFWQLTFQRFYWMGGSASWEEVKCWYKVPKQFPEFAKG